MKDHASNRSGRRIRAPKHRSPARHQSRASARTPAGPEASAPVRHELAAPGGVAIAIRFNPEKPETQITLQVSRVFPPRREYLFGVAQIVNPLTFAAWEAAKGLCFAKRSKGPKDRASGSERANRSLPIGRALALFRRCGRS